MALLDGLSQADKGFADTLTTKAEGKVFDGLAKMYGVPRPSTSPIKCWRPAIKRINFAKRDAIGPVFGMLREGLRFLDKEYTVKIDPNVSKVRITWVSGGGVGGFTHLDLFRLWEIDGIVYRSLFNTGQVEVYSYLDLSPWMGQVWAGCDWLNDPTTPPGQWTNKTAYLLPFVLKGFNAEVFLTTEKLADVPPTFLQMFYDWTLVGSSFGPAGPAFVSTYSFTAEEDTTLSGLTFSESTTVETHLTAVVAEGSAIFPVVNTTDWPANGGFSFTDPLSGAKKDFTYGAKTVNSLTGVVVVGGADGFPLPFDALLTQELTPARGGPFVLTVWKNGVITALTCTLGAADKQVADNVHSVNVSKGDTILFRIQPDATTTKPLTYAKVSLFSAVPNGEPLGGNLQPDGTADDPNSGPWPIYLSGDDLQEWQDLLDNLVAAGVLPHARQVENPGVSQ